MDILLIAGIWLDGSVWDNVAAHLEARGHRAVPVTLPGQGDGNMLATLADQVAAVVAAVDAAVGRPMVVGHSAAGLADERRHDVPVVLVCPEFTPAQAREWIGQGGAPELAKSKTVSFVDIDSGHWPMITVPADLARLLAQTAEES
jgi:pimeloyl-ACP methyl ester carboxylesterase